MLIKAWSITSLSSEAKMNKCRRLNYGMFCPLLGQNLGGSSLPSTDVICGEQIYRPKVNSGPDLSYKATL